jgi:cell wall-associated NlpC family hydrolase
VSRKPPSFARNLVYKRVKTMEGRDVLAVSRCLHRLHYRWKEPTLAYGWQMRDNVQLYRRRQNMNPLGVYDAPTHAHLSPEFDDYERWLYSHVQAPPTQAETDPAGRLMHAIWTMYAQRPWHYNMVRPFILYPVGRHIGYTFDCSWFVTQAFYMAGLQDPNGFGYHGGMGNTSTLQQHGTQVAQARPGDLLFYGSWGSGSDPAHVAMACSERNGMGFGSSGGPRVLPMGYRTIRSIRRYT